jgi:hypothetical protein
MVSPAARAQLPKLTPSPRLVAPSIILVRRLRQHCGKISMRFQCANGALTSDLTIKVPNVSKLWWFKNATTGNFNMFVRVPSGVSPNGLIQIPQGLNVFVMCDGNGNLHRHDRSMVGTAVQHFGTAAPASTLICNALRCCGQSSPISST